MTNLNVQWNNIAKNEDESQKFNIVTLIHPQNTLIIKE